MAKSCPFSAVPKHAPEDHPPIAKDRVGVLLINLGTPDGTTYAPMRRYLSEFLSDRRVIEMNPVLWQPLLQGVILTTRPRKSGKMYERIWNKELDESPLRTYARSQAELLAQRFADTPEVVVDWAMRYGNPSIASRIDALTEQGCRHIVALALYPQYSAASTATAYDKVFEKLQAMRWQPALRTAPPYHDDPVYIEAIAASIREHLATLPEEPEVVLASFHSIPMKYFQAGDPYHCQCAKTTRLVREALGWDEDKLPLTFQSRFDRSEWLQPYTDKTVLRLASEGVKRIAVVTPGFSVDCLETLEEIAIGVAEEFVEAGGERLDVVPCLNDTTSSIDLLEHLARKELRGWIG